MFSKIGAFIWTPNGKSLKSDGALFALQVRQIARESIERECRDLPAEVVKTIKLVSYKNKTLTIELPQMVGAELQARSGGLIKDINRVFGKNIVSALRFRRGR